ncbi:tetratricopeptide repeat protein [Fluviicola chungangensis]|uniref:Tetratricopeptide repeat protein n=1 Tax=Fluviicola chungangensis TaxID=2597671 RepID=A0A556MGP9_9FLAO|nr:tetratricopeptide repeat protein [Fluviicola chungangensis]TSJ39114.1 tetratricopeptide repeat protein [Fluviicola chungangensis]
MKTLVTSILFIACAYFLSFAQSYDSEKQWKLLTNGSENERIEAAKKLSLYYQSESIDSLRMVGETLFFYGIDNHYQPAIEFGKITLAEFYVMNGRINDGIIMAKATLPPLQERGDMALLSNVCRIIASGYRKLDDGNSSMLWAKKAIAYTKDDRESSDKTEGMISLAEAYLLQNKEKLAIETYDSYISKAKRSKNYRGLSTAYARLGDIYRISEKFDLAEKCFKRSYSTALKTNLTSPKAHALNNLAIVYFEKGDTTNALLHFQKALKLRESVNDVKSISESLYNIGDYYFYIEQYAKALIWYQKSTDLAKKNSLLKEEKDGLLALAQVYKELKQFDESTKHLEKALAISSDLKLQQSADDEDLTNLQHEIWRTDFEAFKTEEIKTETSFWIYVLLIAVATLTLTVIFLVIRLNRKKQFNSIFPGNSTEKQEYPL